MGNELHVIKVKLKVEEQIQFKGGIEIDSEGVRLKMTVTVEMAAGLNCKRD